MAAYSSFRKARRCWYLRKNVILILTVLLLLLALPTFSVPRAAGATSFGSPQAVELTPGSSSYPSSLQASDGTLWVAWQQYYETGVYMTYTTSHGWSVIQTLPTGNNFVISPALGQLRNSSIILLWSSNLFVNDTASTEIYTLSLRGALLL